MGVARNEADLSNALEEIEEIAMQTEEVKIEGKGAYNMPWHIWIDLLNMIEVSRMAAESARWREETRGAHFRFDHPEQNDSYGLVQYLSKPWFRWKT